jgi:hypothetical protein
MRSYGSRLVVVGVLSGIASGCAGNGGSAPAGAGFAGASAGATTDAGAGSGNFANGSGGPAGASSDGGASGEGGRGDITPGGAAATAGTAGSPASGGACSLTSDELEPWPGQNTVQTLDMPSDFESDLSGLTFEPETGALWAVNNLSGKLFRLVPSGQGFARDRAGEWSAGKQLRYPSGNGSPDSEGVTLGKDLADGVYVCAEHDNEASGESRLSVLRYDASAAGTTLTATHEWDLTSLLPPVEANRGLEAISWLPDDYLVERDFFDEAKQATYAPADYPNHGAGVFVVGVEQTGKLYVVALDHRAGGATLLASIATPNTGVMGLEFDRDARQLWFNCDDTCGNKSGILDVDTRADSPTRGRFVVTRQFQRPSGLPDSNNEGIAIGSATDCKDGFKPFFWTDDADAAGYSLRRDAIPCAACF